MTCLTHEFPSAKLTLSLVAPKGPPLKFFTNVPAWGKWDPSSSSTATILLAVVPSTSGEALVFPVDLGV